MTYFLSRVVLIALLLSSHVIFAHADDYEVDPGQITFRVPVSNTDFEQIDPYTGALTLIYKDLVLPGNGGLDLEVIRRYRSNYPKNETWLSFYPYSQSALGLGWNIHFGRMKIGTDQVAIELNDGTSNTAFKEEYPTYRTKEFWKVNAAGRTLQLTDGTEIVFAHGGTYELSEWCYATEIRKNNNSIYIYYRSGTNILIDRVVDSLGRQINFNYDVIDNNYRLTSLTYGSKTLVSYSYPLSGDKYIYSTLSKVIFPDAGDTWEYDYDTFAYEGGTRYGLSTVTTPYGGIVNYSHAEFFKIGSGSLRQFSVNSKTVSGSNIATGTWDYDYGTIGYPQEYETFLFQTTITDPCNRKTIYHFLGYLGGGNEPSYASCYKYGLTKRKFVTHKNEVNENVIDEAIEYTWDKLPDVLSDDQYSVAFICRDERTHVPIVTQQTVYHGGTLTDSYLYPEDPDVWAINNPTGVYVTKYGGHDVYGNPQRTKEYDEIPLNELTPALRTIDREYFYNTVRNIVKDTPTDEIITGSTNFPGTFSSSYVYDTYGNILQEDRFGVVTNRTYHVDTNNLASITDANDHTTTYEWDKGVISEIHNPIYSISRTINWDGTVASETNGENHTTSYSYTPGMRIETIAPPLANPTTFSYSFGAGTKSIKTRGGFSNWTNYDGLGREIERSDSVGISYSTAFDSCGLKEYTNSNVGDKVNYDYFGRPELITHKDNTTIHYTYLNDSHLQITDEMGLSSYQTFQSFGDPDEKLLVQVTDAHSKYPTSTSYSYNILGSLTKTSRAGVDRVFRYDNRNFLYEETHPETGTISYGRDGLGNIKTKTDWFGIKTYNYDGLNRLKEIISPDGTLKYYYNKVDEVTSMVSPYGTVTYEYDKISRLKKIKTIALGVTSQVSYAYDANDNITWIGHYPAGVAPLTLSIQAIYEYNTLNQVRRIWMFGGQLNEIEYYKDGVDPPIFLGLLKKYTLKSGLTTQFTYNLRRMMTRSESTASDLSFVYDDPRGNLTSMVNNDDPTKNRTFVYDDINRLSRFDGPWGGGSYVYDIKGNRLQKIVNKNSTNYTYDEVHNRLTGDSTGRAFDYNDNGDMRSLLEENGITYDLEYDRFHNMKHFSSGSSLFNVNYSYGYDCNGQRIYKDSTLDRIIYVNDKNGNVLSEVNGKGEALASYIYLNGNLVARVEMPAARKEATVAPWLHLLLRDTSN